MQIDNKGIKIAYYPEGEGEPLVLIRGYASAASLWYLQVPEWSHDFKVISFDNRDTGNSDRVETPYAVADMAGDVIALLEQLNLGPVHLLGLSMGGMIAQQTALIRPDLIQTLILCSTTCNSFTGLSSDPEVMKLFATLPELSDEENVRRSLPIFFASETLTGRKDLIEEFIRQSLAQRPPLTTFARHKQAIQGFQVCQELHRISMPTLILHGGTDLLLPPANAWEIQKQIPSSKIKIYESLGHMFFMEAAETFNKDVIDFIKDPTAFGG